MDPIILYTLIGIIFIFTEYQ